MVPYGTIHGKNIVNICLDALKEKEKANPKKPTLIHSIGFSGPVLKLVNFKGKDSDFGQP
jgi:hypothetical protein